MWQTKPDHPERLDPNQVYGTDGSHPAITGPLQRWAGEANWKTTGGWPVRPWYSPENQQVAKTSKDSSVVTPPRYDTSFPLPSYISLWVVDNQGNQISFKEHGPFPGWKPLNYADNSILWCTADNRMSFWVVDNQGNQVSFKEQGPFPGWRPLNYADNRILWRV